MLLKKQKKMNGCNDKHIGRTSKLLATKTANETNKTIEIIQLFYDES